MTIALITPYFPDEGTIDSGIANHFFLLAKSLANEDNKVVVIHTRCCYSHESEGRYDHILDKNITVATLKVKVPAVIRFILNRRWAMTDFVLKLRSMLFTGGELNRIIQQYNIDVIETTSYFSLCYFASLKKIKVPLAIRVSTTFSQIIKEHYPFKSRLMNIIAEMEISLIKRNKYLVTHAHSHARELEQIYQIKAEKFKIIPHGIELPTLDREVHHGQPLKVLYVGRMEYRKGIDVLLEAIPLILGQRSDIIFELVGNDPNGDYQNRFESNNNDEVLKQVTFNGKIDKAELSKAYQRCDIFVAPSRYESFGLIFIEAMSFGKPVIGCNVGGVSEIIRDHYNGLFAEKGNAQSLADKILELTDDPNLRKRLGTNALTTVMERFTEHQLANNSLTYYCEIIADFDSCNSR